MGVCGQLSAALPRETDPSTIKQETEEKKNLLPLAEFEARIFNTLTTPVTVTALPCQHHNAVLSPRILPWQIFPRPNACQMECSYEIWTRRVFFPPESFWTQLLQFITNIHLRDKSPTGAFHSHLTLHCATLVAIFLICQTNVLAI